MANAAELKTMAARAAMDEIEDGMRLGIGSGSTAESFVNVLAQRVESGLRIVGIATSERTEALCRARGVPMSTLEETPELDLAVDGADEIDGRLRLIKGGGGALLREKIVAAAAERMIVIADGSKLVETLGAFPLPIEINGFGMIATYLAIQRAAAMLGLEGEMTLRRKGEEAFITDGGHLIVDASFGRIEEPEALATMLQEIPGVVQHGLFIGLATRAIVAGETGIRIIDGGT